jgi:dCMP deaminase
MDASPIDDRTKKRSNYLSWDDYFMAVAALSAQRSKDPNTQVGACIVNRQKRIVGVGYNGFPTGCSDDALPWGREGDFLETKYPYVCHAELNAVLNSVPGNLAGCTIYSALFPCNECAKVIIQAGIKEVVYLSDKYAATDSARAARVMFDQVGIACRQLAPSHAVVTIQLKDLV